MVPAVPRLVLSAAVALTVTAWTGIAAAGDDPSPTVRYALAAITSATEIELA